MRVPVQIVSGFLGAGKTTAIRAQLETRRGERVAVIVNDFGEASLDEAALEPGEPYRITNIPGGCVCCTAPEGFVEALGAVLAERPDRLLIEPTGLARPQDLIDTIRRCAYRDDVSLAPVLVLVDPRQLSRLEEVEPEALALLREQVQGADVLVANRRDLCDEDDLARFRTLAAELWPAPLAVHVTQQAVIPPALFEWPVGEGPRAPRVSEAVHAPHDHDHRADSTEGFRARSWRWSPEVVFSRDRLTAALQGLATGELPGGAGDGATPVRLERFKGIFRTQEGVSRLEVAGGVLHDRLTSYRRDSRADAIVRASDDAALEAIGARLDAAVLRPEELELDAHRLEVVLPTGAVHALDRKQLAALPDGLEDVSLRFPKRAGSAARVSALLDRLGVDRAGEAVVVAADGFASEPVALSVLREGVLLHTLEGEPLPEKQGGPFRLLIPESASPDPVSCANVKGAVKIAIRAPRWSPDP